jgi:hypothetical protein
MARRLTRSASTVLAILAALAVRAAPAGADWLVLRDGSRVETKGAWEVKGRLVVFTAAANGSLASVRGDQVDLQASAEATAAAKAPPPSPESQAAEEPAKKATIVLTDADVASVGDEGVSLTVAEEDEAVAEDEAATPEETPARGRLAVIDWDRNDLAQGLEVVGTLRNDTPDTATNVTLTVILFGADGKQVGRGAGVLASSLLPPGGTSTFRAEFPNLSAFSAAKFESDGTFFRTEGADIEVGEADDLGVEEDDEAGEEAEEPPPEP